MATDLQKKAFNIRAQKLKEKKPVVMGEVMLEAGFSKKTSKRPKDLTTSKGWQELLVKYDDEPIMDLIYEEALSKSDKRNATANRDIYLKLKDRYPQKTNVAVSIFQKIDNIIDD